MWNGVSTFTLNLLRREATRLHDSPIPISSFPSLSDARRPVHGRIWMADGRMGIEMHK